MSDKGPRIRLEDTSGQGLPFSVGQVLLVFWSSSLQKLYKAAPDWHEDS